LKISQKQLAILAGVTVQGVQGWEQGRFSLKAKTKARLAALRKLGRIEVKKLLAQKGPEAPKERKIKDRSQRLF